MLVVEVSSVVVCGGDSWRRKRSVTLGNCCDDMFMYFLRMSSARTNSSDALRRSSRGTSNNAKHTVKISVYPPMFRGEYTVV